MSDRLPAAERRRQLVAVATDTFGDRGFHHTSMNDVAAAAGVTKPVLYQHFTSKEDLFQAVLRHVGAHLRDRLADAAAGDDLSPRQRLERGFAAYYRFLRDERPSARVLFGEARRTDEHSAAQATHAVESITEAVTDFIDDALDPAARLALASGIVGLAEGAGRWWVRHDTGLDADRLAALTADLAWSGLQGS